MLKTNNMNNYQKGIDAEYEVLKELENQGHRILEQRLKSKFGEIDILSFKDKEYFLTEVKNRTNLKPIHNIFNSSIRKCFVNFS